MSKEMGYTKLERFGLIIGTILLVFMGILAWLVSGFNQYIAGAIALIGIYLFVFCVVKEIERDSLYKTWGRN